MHSLIKFLVDAVHHYDEYGLADIRDEPLEIMQIHLEMIHFVKEWLKDWDSELEERRKRSMSTWYASFIYVDIHFLTKYFER